MIHHSAAYYANGSFVINGVKSANLAGHIKYNRIMRPGRSLFINGLCVLPGYLEPAQTEAIETRLAGVTISKDTAPYK